MIGKRTALAALTSSLFFGGLNTAAEAKASIVTFDPPGDSGGIWVAAINTQDTVVGFYQDTSSHIHGFVRTSDGTITTIDGAGSTETTITSVNDKGTVVGDTFENGREYCFLKRANAKLRPFKKDCSATSINNAGVIAGGKGQGQAFVWDKGVTTTFVVLNKATIPVQINDEGTVTGYYYGSKSTTHGFLRAADGTVTTFDVPYAAHTQPTSINAGGEITGWYTKANGSRQGSFLRAADGTITTFRYGEGVDATAIDKKGQIAGVVLNKAGLRLGLLRSSDGSTVKRFLVGDFTSPTAINDHSTIVGVSFDANGVEHGFVRTR